MIDPVTEKIQNMDGRFFWDKKHNNLNFEGDKLVYPFGLDENDRKPGYFAYVTTCFPLINNANRFDQDRFIPLHVSNTIEQGEDVVFTDHALERLPLSRNTVRDIVAEERGEHYHDTKGRPGIRRILYQHSIIVVNYSETPPVVITGYPAPVPHKFRNNARFQLRTDSDTR